MKINEFFSINANAETGDFMWVITGKSGLCAYYTMSRDEANRVIEALRVGSADWWQEQFKVVEPYLPLVPVETYDDPDPGDVSDRTFYADPKGTQF